MTTTVLITGGAGYIGSHAVYAFLESGYEVVVLDNLDTGVQHVLPKEVPFYKGDISDIDLIRSLLQDHRCRAAVHFAGSIVVPESVTNPLLYYHNNTVKSHALVKLAVECELAAFLFSSTAAVYGMGGAEPLKESDPLDPINPYGRSKLATEWVVRDTAAAHGLATGILRYFNVAGADPQQRTGQCSPNATHLIKVAAEAGCGKRPGLAIYGTDYDTPDGTCIRDYIHVSDLAQAHVATLTHLLRHQSSVTFNCGYSQGYSVREVIETVQKHAPQAFEVTEAPRRAGDPPSLIADCSLLKQTVGWVPEYNDLDTIIKSALDWETHLLQQSAA